MAKLFGFEFRRAQDKDEDDIVSFAPAVEEDGAVVVSAGGSYGTYVDLDGTIRSEVDLVTKYREISLHPEVENAIDDIVNEAIVHDFNDETVEIILDQLNLNDTVNKAIIEEFDNVKSLLEFQNLGHEVFRRWYIDGRLYYHAIIDEKKPQDGIKELRYIDPRKIRKVREQSKKRLKNAPTVVVNKTVGEYFIYNERGFNRTGNNIAQSGSTSGIKIAADSIVYTTSGLLSPGNDMVISYLHKAIKPLNQLRALEDATIIYKLSRAPDRRVFYIDVGTLPKMKAEQYVRDMMTKFKNKVVYDASTGSVRDDRKFMTMLEDFWLPRREGGRGTEISTLNGSTNFSDMSDVEYFQRNLYKSLNVPVSRLQSDTPFNMGRSSEISRDEIKFSKFIKRLRNKFAQLFIKVLEKQLILKKIVSYEEFQEWKNFIKFKFNEDNMFEEIKEIEILSSRLNLLKDIQDSIGKYYSNQWVQKNVLRFSDQMIEDMQKQIQEEQSNAIYNPPIPGEQDQGQTQEEQPDDEQSEQKVQ